MKLTEVNRMTNNTFFFFLIMWMLVLILGLNGRGKKYDQEKSMNDEKQTTNWKFFLLRV